MAGGECEDDVYKDCQRRVEAGYCTGEAGTEDPHQEARMALAECRQSCRDLLNNNQSELPTKSNQKISELVTSGRDFLIKDWLRIFL